MKTTKLFSVLVLVINVFLFACSSEDETPPNTGGENPDSSPTSITLTADKNSFNEGGTITFTVKTDLGVNVTSQSVIKVNGTAISGNTYTGTTVGSYIAKATYESLTSSELPFTVNATVTSVEVRTNVTAINAGELVTFFAEAHYSDGSTQDKTSETVFSVNGTEIVGNKHIGFTIGTSTITGTFSSVTSDAVSVQVNQVSTPSTYTKKAVVEDFTGTWCGWCPRVSHALTLVEAQSNKVFTVAAHINDAMENSYSIALKNALGVSGYPTAYIDRETRWSAPETSNVSQATDAATGSTNLGLAVNSVLSGQTMQVVVSTGFAQSVSGTKLVVFILEDGLTYSQSNYTGYYGGVNPVSNFEHNHVLRYSVTNVLGNSTTTTSGVHHTSSTINLSTVANISNTSNTAVLAMLVDSTGKKVLNAQYAKVNIAKTFD